MKCKLCGLVSKQDFNKFQVSKMAQTRKNKGELPEPQLKCIGYKIDITLESLVNYIYAMGERWKEEFTEKEALE